MNLGEKLNNIRREHKISQEDFAEIFNVSRQTVSSWENSKSYPNIETLIKISNRFNISLDDLLKDEKMVRDIDTKVKNSNKFKIIIVLLVVFIFFICILIYLFPDKMGFQNYSVIKVKCKYDEKDFEYVIDYNKFLGYKISSSFQGGIITKEMTNEIMNINNQNMKAKEEADYIKKLLEKNNGVCKIEY